MIEIEIMVIFWFHLMLIKSIKLVFFLNFAADDKMHVALKGEI